MTTAKGIRHTAQAPRKPPSIPWKPVPCTSGGMATNKALSTSGGWNASLSATAPLRTGLFTVLIAKTLLHHFHNFVAPDALRDLLAGLRIVGSDHGPVEIRPGLQGPG